MKRIIESTKEGEFRTLLKKGDTVMVITGGNPKRGRVLKGQTGKILRFIPKRGRVVVEGLNMIKRHKRQQSMQEAGGIIQREGSIAISNVMFYSEELKRPVRLRSQLGSDGKKVRGYVNPKTKKFEAV